MKKYLLSTIFLMSSFLGFAQTQEAPQPRISLAKSARVRVAYTYTPMPVIAPLVVSAPMRTEENRDLPSGTVFGVSDNVSEEEVKKEPVKKVEKPTKGVGKKTDTAPAVPAKITPAEAVTGNTNPATPRTAPPVEKVAAPAVPTKKAPAEAVVGTTAPATPRVAPPAEKVAVPVKKAPVEVVTRNDAPAPAATPRVAPPVKKVEVDVVAKPEKKLPMPAPAPPKPARPEPVVADEAIVIRGELKGGLRRVLLKSNAKWGYVNKNYVPVIAFRFDRAFDFSGGEARVEFEGKPRRINKQGDFIK
ncbi:MAG: WG repeat-containing protein [Cytophagaceae bacterium]|nr:WG repeat-containing protein [Cytophagaceae bacterium]